MSDLPDLPAEEGVEIVGPFEHRELVVDGWTVPFIQAIEEDGGRVLFLVDHRMGYSVCAGDFEQVARLVADATAIARGMSAHPPADLRHDDRERWFAGVPFLLRPSRLIGISGMSTEEADVPDDPRNEESA